MTKTHEKMEMANKLEPVTWDEIKDFYKQNFNEELSENFRESFCYAWSISRKMPVIDLLATGFLAGYEAAELKAKIEFAAKYDHKSPLQVIAAEYVKRRGTIGPLALLEENRFIDGYEAGLHASRPQWISVKDRLPNLEKTSRSLRRESSCILLVSYGNVYAAHLCEDWSDRSLFIFEACTCNCRAFDMEIDEWKLDQVTHWMPLPKPPEEK